MRIVSAVGLVAVAGAVFHVGSSPRPAPDAGIVARELALPLAFERNDGQTDSRVAFVARPRGVTLFLEPAAATFAWRDASIRMRAVGAVEDASARGADELEGKVNYLLGNDPSGWRTGVPTFTRVETPSVYPGIAMAWYGSGRDAEYDFEVAPGADPSLIALAFDGAESVSVEDSGDLVVRVARHELRHRKPTVYEESGGERRPVEGRFVLRDDDLVAFEVDGRDPSARLVIDPLAIAWSDYFGGTERETCIDVGVDGSKNPIVAGTTTSLDFPVTNGAYDTTSSADPVNFLTDVVITKFKADGTARLFSTYLGGAMGDDVTAIAVSNSGVATVVGTTGSEDFPATGPDTTPGDGVNMNGFYGDGFVTRLNAAGNGLEWSTYLGGTDASTIVNDVAVDSSGAAYLTGTTNAADFPVTQSALIAADPDIGSDAFFTVISAGGGGAGPTLAYSTYVGANGINEKGHGIAIDANGGAWIAGTAQENGGVPGSFTGAAPVRAFANPGAGYSDVFAVRITPARAWAWMTYLGGQYDELYDQGSHQPLARIAVDADANAFVCGTTNSIDFPVGSSGSVPAELPDAFVTKFDGNGALQWSRFVGSDSSSEESATGIAIDAQGRAHICGYTAFGTFPLVDATPNGRTSLDDAFYSVVKADGSGLDRSSLLGSTSEDVANGLALVSDGSVYVVGQTRSTGGVDHFPIVGGVQQVAAGDAEGFVTKYTTGQGGEVKELKVLKGTITDSTKFFKDKVEFGGTLPVPENFDPRPLPLRLMLTPSGLEQSFDVFIGDVEANDPRWKEKKGKYTLKFSAPGDAIHITLVVDPKKGLFAISANNFSFSFPVANPIKFSISFGQSFAFEKTQTWTQKGVKFKLP